MVDLNVEPKVVTQSYLVPRQTQSNWPSKNSRTTNHHTFLSPKFNFI